MQNGDKYVERVARQGDNPKSMLREEILEVWLTIPMELKHAPFRQEVRFEIVVDGDFLQLEGVSKNTPEPCVPATWRTNDRNAHRG
ncbi:hypothetical protein GCM10022276_14060 [Sphingomonas limnosediminicola]|uniref:Hsp20/alpha crystallin family protein n=1 Tax=Sphingomonas limnosediminicola TaxID=940133 RepID=A0ABP7LCB1_9SPHN